MKPINTLKWVILFLTVVIIATAAQCQDSVALKVLSKPVTIKDTTYYLVRISWIDGPKEKVIVKCCCRDKTIRQKGEMVMVAKKDLLFE